MDVIRPINITSSMLISTTATDATAAYNAGTSYSTGQVVQYQQYRYESLQNSNTGNTPDVSPTWWLLLGPTNDWAMFDTSVSTQTTATSPLTVQVEPGASFTSAAFVNIENATLLNVKVYDSNGGTVQYDQDIDLDDTIINDWFDYFFAEFEFKTELVVNNLPPYNTGVIEASFTSTSSPSVGAMIIGNGFYLGTTQYGLNYGIRDYSIKSTDDFGNTTFVERAFSRRMEPNVIVENIRLNAVSKNLSNLRATPTVWIASTDSRFQSTIVYGYMKDYNIEINYPTTSLIRLEIEGLT